MRKIYHISLSILLTCIGFGALQAQNNQKTPLGSSVKQGEFIVIYDKKASFKLNGQQKSIELFASELKSRLGVTVKRELLSNKAEVWKTNGNYQEALKLAKSIPGAKVIPNFTFRRPEVKRSKFVRNSQSSNDELISEQWALNNDGSFTGSVINADIDGFEAWEVAPKAITAQGDTVNVVVFDTGIDKNHPDLVGNVYPNSSGLNYDAFYDNFTPTDGDGHGTHVAGIIGARGNNGIGVSGINQVIKIIDVRIFDENGDTTTEAILAAFDWVAQLLESGVKIAAVNHSWGGAYPLGEEGVDELITLVQTYAMQSFEYNTLWLIAAGNDSEDMDASPYFDFPSQIEAPNIIVVGSTTFSNEVSDFSNYGFRNVHIGAPGSDILSTVPTFLDEESPYQYFSGTSMATPYVAGVAGMIAAQFPDEDVLARSARILATTSFDADYTEYWNKRGLLNANVAVRPSVLEQTEIKTTGTAYFHISLFDSEGVEIAGFVNNTESEITVNSVQITGADASLFSLVTTDVLTKQKAITETASISPEGSYAVQVNFSRPVEDTDQTEFLATVEFSTSVGLVTVELNALIPGYPLLAVTPMMSIVEDVDFNQVITDEFEIGNVGNSPLNFVMVNTLLNLLDIDFGISAVNNQAAVAKSSLKPKRSKGEGLKTRTDLIKAAYSQKGIRESSVYKLQPSLKKSSGSTFFEHDEILWSDSLNNPVSVAEDWVVLDYFDRENAPSWELVTQNENSFFLFGDVETGYSSEAATIALSPVFDFSDVSTTGVGPAYLYFDYAAQMEEGFDILSVALFVNGEFFGEIGSSDINLFNDGEIYKAALDISSVAGFDYVEFVFAAFSDEDIEEGFGALFDNVMVSIAPSPFYTSLNQGVINPGESLPVELTVNTAYLGEGAYFAISTIMSDAANGTEEPGVAAHILAFALMHDVQLSAETDSVHLGDVGSTGIANTTFSITNTGSFDVMYSAITSISTEWNEEFLSKNPDLLAKASLSNTVKDAVGARPVLTKQSVPRDRKAQRKNPDFRRLSPNKTIKTPVVSSGKGKSRLFKQLPGISNVTEIGYENFDSSEVLPEGWEVFEYTELGGAPVWELMNISDTQALIDNALVFGDPDSFTYGNDADTEVYSPYYQVIKDEQKTYYLEFDYASYIEAEYDSFEVYLYIEDGDFFDYTYLGGSNDLIGYEDEGSISIEITELIGRGEFYIGFYVYSDEDVNDGLVVVDNFYVYEVESTVSLNPANGVLAVNESADITMSMDLDAMFSGDYVATTVFAYTAEISEYVREMEHHVFFTVNEKQVSTEETHLPAQFIVQQNYPNPFNPSTQIKFAVPSDQRVTVEVFNMIGQKVATLANSQAYSAGFHSVTFDATGLSSGTYIYRVQAQDVSGNVQISNNTMVLIK